MDYQFIGLVTSPNNLLFDQQIYFDDDLIYVYELSNFDYSDNLEKFGKNNYTDSESSDYDPEMEDIPDYYYQFMYDELNLDILTKYQGQTWYRTRQQYQNLQDLNIPDKNLITNKILNLLKKDILQQQFSSLFTQRQLSEQYLIEQVQVCNQLPLNPQEKQILIELIDKLGENTKDFHESENIQNIIDPDLNPYYPNYSIDPSFYVDEIYQQKINQQCDNLIKFTKNQVELYKVKSQNKENNEYISLRSQYQWIPTQFQINHNSQVEIKGNIHNLPRENNQELYTLIQRVIVEMIPAFKQLEIINFDNQTEISDKQQEVCTLQVIVKIYKQFFYPKTIYDGKWQLEGKTENIKAIGTYYCQIDPKLQYSYLKISKKDINYQYYKRDLEDSQNNVVIQDGSAVIFKNYPHKVSEITNYTDEKLSRTVLTFLIVDPQKPLKDTLYLQNLKSKLTKKYGCENLEQKLRKHGFEINKEIGKQKRSQIWKNLDKEQIGWAVLQTGLDNDHDTYYIDGFQVSIKKDTYIDEFDQQQSKIYPIDENNKIIYNNNKK